MRCMYSDSKGKRNRCGDKAWFARCLTAVMAVTVMSVVIAVMLTACAESVGSCPGTISTITASLTIEEGIAYCMGDCMADKPDCIIELTAALQHKDSKGKWVDYYTWYTENNSILGASLSKSIQYLPIGDYRLLLVAKAYNGETLLDTARIASQVETVAG